MKHSTILYGMGEYGDAFKQGLEKFKQGDFQGALPYFNKAVGPTDNNDPYRKTYISFSGLTKIYLGDKSALSICRTAADGETQNPDVYYVLAYAEMEVKGRYFRKRVIQAIDKGKQIDPGHRGLQSLHEALGIRRSPALPFLRRQSFINRLLGKWTYNKRKRRSNKPQTIPRMFQR